MANRPGPVGGGHAVGDCLLCDEAFAPPWEFDQEVPQPDTAAATTTPMQLVVAGEGKAFLGLGEPPQRVLHLIRYTPHPPPRDAVWPSLLPLEGEWIFVDLWRENILPAVRFTEQSTETVTAGLDGQELPSPRSVERAISDEGRVEIRCYERGFACEVRLAENVYSFSRSHITPE